MRDHRKVLVVIMGLLLSISVAACSSAAVSTGEVGPKSTIASPSIDATPAVALPTNAPRLLAVVSGQDNWFDLHGNATTFAIRTPANGENLTDIQIWAMSADGRRVKVGGGGGAPASVATGLESTPKDASGGFRVSLIPGGPAGRRQQVWVLASSWDWRKSGKGSFRWPDEQ